MSNLTFTTQSSLEAEQDAAISAIRDMQKEYGVTPEIRELVNEVLTLKFNKDVRASK